MKPFSLAHKFAHEIGHLIPGEMLGRKVADFSLAGKIDPLFGTQSAGFVEFATVLQNPIAMPPAKFGLEDLIHLSGSNITETHLTPRLQWSDAPTQIFTDKQILNHTSADREAIQATINSLFTRVMGRMPDGREFKTPKDWLRDSFTPEQLQDWKRVIQQSPEKAKQHLTNRAHTLAEQMLGQFFQRSGTQPTAALRKQVIEHYIPNPNGSPHITGDQFRQMEQVAGFQPTLSKENKSQVSLFVNDPWSGFNAAG